MSDEKSVGRCAKPAGGWDSLMLVTRLEEQPHANPNTETMEFSLRDLDGYYVTISALFAA